MATADSLVRGRPGPARFDNRRASVFAWLPVPSRINSPKVIHQVFDTEVVVVNLETGNYYSISDGGIEIWRSLDAGISSEVIRRQFAAAGLEEEARRFLAELETEQLILPDSPTAAAEPAAPVSIASPIPPRLEKFTDMRELLLVDPIHELDESGWPTNPPPAGTK